MEEPKTQTGKELNHAVSEYIKAFEDQLEAKGILLDSSLSQYRHCVDEHVKLKTRLGEVEAVVADILEELDPDRRHFYELRLYPTKEEPK